MKLSPSDNWRVPFHLNFFTATPIDGKIAGRSLYCYTAGYDGTTYSNCHPANDGGLVITFERHRLSPGTLCVEARYYLNDNTYDDGTCDMAVVPEPVTDADGNTFIVTCNENTRRKFSAELLPYFHVLSGVGQGTVPPLYVDDKGLLNLQIGTGLKIDEDGKIYVDLSALMNI